MAGVSEDVRRFVDRYVATIEELEVLLLLQRNAQQWTSAAVAARLRIGGAAADRDLAKLCSHNLLNVRIGQDLFYWFDPRPRHLKEGAQALAAAYAEDPLAIIRLIVERPPAPIRDFAEAFRLSKKDDSDG